jgi:exodeoxyribonuclease VII large subunit
MVHHMSFSFQADPRRDIYTVSRLNAAVRSVLERGLGVVWVEGELSNLSQPASGHWYFTLKDRDAQLRCAMFRIRNASVGFTPRAGQHVLVRGRVSIYEPRGDYQLIAEHLEEAGVGALKREFERLKTELAADGLFAQERKRPLPRFPRRIGIVTSPTGAAIRDILHILGRRFPPAAVLIYPTPVQGEDAVPSIVRALQLASARAECDVLIVTRGGGSIEDLWAFNDERVARAMASCSIPVISGIGHEVDFTIADFVADVRAPTPSGAAELVVPDRNACLEALARAQQRLRASMQRELRTYAARFDGLRLRLKLTHPGVRLLQQAQRLDDLEQRMSGCIQRELRASIGRIAAMELRFKLALPGVRLAPRWQQLEDLQERLSSAMRTRLHSDGNRMNSAFARLVLHSPDRLAREYRLLQEALAARLTHAARDSLSRAGNRLGLAQRALNAVSPLATLTRGFAVVTKADGTLVSDARQVRVGEEIEARLGKGRITASVTGKDSPT